MIRSIFNPLKLGKLQADTRFFSCVSLNCLTSDMTKCSRRSVANMARSKTRKSRKPRKVIFRCFLSEFSSATKGIFENSEDESSENVFRGFQEIRVFELPLLTELSKD